MAMGGGLMDFVQRFQNIQLQRDTSDELIKDLLIYSERVEVGLRKENERLQSELRDAKLDLADATKSRRELQQLLQQAESKHASVSQDYMHLKNQNPYVIVVIDGDGLLFQEQFVRLGLEGGKKAAYALRSAILEQCGDHAKDIEVFATCYANLDGLGKAMVRDGSLDSENTLKAFAAGFTQSKSTFDFVDVGRGKERADNKLKDITKWNLRNYNCQQVILGISHDAGYAPYVDDLLQDQHIRERVTVLEGFPMVRELRATGVKTLNLTNDLFRSEKLVDRVSVSHEAYIPAAAAASATSVGGLVITPATSTASTPAMAHASYARITSPVSPPPTITLPLQPRTANAANRPAAAAKAAWNPGPRGLDPPIQVSQSALESIKKRRDNNKLCNNHYLRGPCAKGDACCFEHRYKPTKDEINAIAFLSRLQPCAHGQDCDVDDCIYGHHCPSVRDGQCAHPYCKYEESEHPPGTKFKQRY